MKIQAHPDITGAAPADSAWYAIDADTYDGAPDAGACSVIGFGRTGREAVADLLEQMDWGEPWQREDAREYRAANGQFGVGA